MFGTCGAPQMEIRIVDVELIIDLRHAVLRAGHLRETAHFEGDDEPTARHFAVLESDRVIGCATLVERPYHGEQAWQLRGMAVAEERRGQGIGGKLLVFIESTARHEGPHDLLWCNARVESVGFYENRGWRVDSAVFDIVGVGRHRRMSRGVGGETGDRRQETVVSRQRAVGKAKPHSCWVLASIISIASVGGYSPPRADKRC